jgi:TPP-dependent pyruvate/acetoin dehydrogenase alpha subunit
VRAEAAALPAKKEQEEFKMVKSNRMRRNHQADYQRAYRQQQKASRTPSRDDVARLALHLMISEGLKEGQERNLADWCETVTTGLVEQGFDPDATRHRIDQLIERCADGWGFQLKRHLTQHTIGQPQ